MVISIQPAPMTMFASTNKKVNSLDWSIVNGQEAALKITYHYLAYNKVYDKMDKKNSIKPK